MDDTRAHPVRVKPNIRPLACRSTAQIINSYSSVSETISIIMTTAPVTLRYGEVLKHPLSDFIDAVKSLRKGCD